MELLASKLSGLPLVSMQNAFKVGAADRFVIDPETGEFLGLLTKAGWLSKPFAVTSHEIVGLTNEAIIIRNIASLNEPDEIIRIKEALKTATDIIGSGVYTEAGEYLGKAFDFSVDEESRKLTRILAKSALKKIIKGNLEIAQEFIVRIEPKKIIVKDSTVKEAAAAVVASPIGT